MINIEQNRVIIGIYKITSPSGKVYIGEAMGVKERWAVYRRLKCKDQIKLYRSLLKYGFENHKFEVIEECSKELLLEREVYYKQLELDKVKGDFSKVLFCRLYDRKGGPLTEEMKRNIKNSYTPEVRARMSKAKKGKVKYSEESKLKMSLNKRNKPLSEHHLNRLKNQKTKLVNQYDLQGNFIKTWKSQKEIFKTLKIRTAISLTKDRPAGGYIWKY